MSEPSSISRRGFLRVAAAAAIGTGAGAPGHALTRLRPLVGSQLYVWGQYYAREGKQLANHLPDVLSALRDAGYDYAEPSLGSRTANERFASLAKERGLQVTCIYCGGSFHDAQKAEKNVETLLSRAAAAKQLGFRILNCNPDPIGRAKTDDELATQAKWLQVLGEELIRRDMELAVHHHLPEMANGAKEFHANFRQTDPGKVKFCYDVHWVWRGGVKPPEVLEAYGKRVASWHLRQSRENIWWEDLDTGDVDYAFIAEYANSHSLPQVFTVELALEQGTKITRTVVQNHARSREFVKRVFSA